MVQQTEHKPMRVAAVIGKMVRGGVESVVFNYARAMQKRWPEIGFDFYYDDDSTQPPPEDLVAAGARFYRIPRYQRMPAFLSALVRAFRKEGYTIVHSHLNTMSVFPLFAAWLAGVPVRICHNHSTDHAGEGKKSLLKRALRPFARVFATDYFACGDTAARWMYGDAAVDEGQVTVLANAVDKTRYGFDAAARAELRSELGIAESTFVLGHIGRFTYAKNHNGLLEIFAALKEQRDDAVLLLVGEGEREEEIRGQVAAMGLSDSVCFLGVRKDANRLYSAFDAFCLPSFYEGLPVVGVELQWNGLPAVFSDRVTREALVNENVRMLSLIEPASVWAEALLSLRRQAPDAAMERFDIERQAERLAAYYRQKG